MMALQHLFEIPAALALAWTLIHSLWEGTVVALLLAALLSVPRSSHSRYLAATAALGTLVTSCAATYFFLLPHFTPALSELRFLPVLPPLPNGLPDFPARSGVSEALPWLAPFWLAGVAAFHVRSAVGWIVARRLRQRGVCQAPQAWRRRLDELRVQARVAQPVLLMESCLSAIPLVMGHVRPVILVPLGFFTGMPASQVEAILLHELAHIRRRDYLVNLVQTVIDGFFFYHPAAWWISGVIRAEREHCCDDLAVSEGGNASAYASALLILEQTRGIAPEAALAATGGNLMRRIRRLLYPKEVSRSSMLPVVSALVLTLTAALTVSAWQPPAPTVADQLDKYTTWLEIDVSYIITANERAAFLRLSSDPERDMFMKQFWERRGAPAKEEHYRRFAFANSRFGTRAGVSGWKTDRGRIYIIFGAPDEIEDHPDAHLEQWLYHQIPNVGTNVVVDFVDAKNDGNFLMTQDPTAN